MSVFDIQFELSPILTKFDKYVKELGKLEVKCSTLKKILLRKEKQGQLFVPDFKTVDDIILTNIRSFQTPKGTSKDTFITDVDMFEDGRIVLADDERLNKRLVIMNQVGEYIKTVPLDDQCYDAVIDKDTVATTLVFAKTVVIIDVNSSNVQRTIHTKDKCYGILSKGKQLTVSLYNKTIQFFDLSRNTFSTLSIAEISVHCSMFSDKLYYTTHNSDAVYSITLRGEVRWKFNCQKSDYPAGITNDASGNIFVACRDSNKLMVVGPDGKKSRILLTTEDGLDQTKAIHYNHKSRMLLVCNLSGQCFLYKVTK
ncbi:Hypothetical predicted protein [Mytilus galloprovincialis]|uniref:Uncharacterized protein n=1 Tax=Mytilus galloprovincialis TaxID=29158 RepID=A0A8B6GUU9_MYTGA|nr:Hypothetical predicted protein [Mytilus galloprovincialis]